jgi:preprotein translocase subunit SecE
MYAARERPGLEGTNKDVCDRKAIPAWPEGLVGIHTGPAIKEGCMKKLVQFIKESYAELRKVIWPSREDVISSVKVVIVSTIIVAAVLGLVDVLLLFGIRAIF